MRLKITPTNKFKGKISLPGDKSISHRAAIIGAIASGKTVIENFSNSEDCNSTLVCLKGLGVDLLRTKDRVVVNGVGLYGFCEPDDILFCGNSGTTMRLLCGVLTGQNFNSVLNGDDSLRRRPMDRIIKPLRAMGAKVWARCNNKYAPIFIKGHRLTAIEYSMPVASAQLKSALLLAGLYTKGKQVVIEPTTTRDHTERMLRSFRCDLLKKKNRITLGRKRQPRAQKVAVPGDISSAAFFIALACLRIGSEIFIENVGINPTRTGIILTLKNMGVKLTILNKRIICNEPVSDILVRGSQLNGVELSGAIIPMIIDELPVMAVIATQAKGTTIVRNAEELRVKETDRIRAIVSQLRNMGAQIIERKDGFIVEGPTRLRGVKCKSFGDHRIAMALTIAGLIADGETTIEDAESINISFPEFITKIKVVTNKRAIEEVI